MTDSELKPCPFCGCEAKHDPIAFDGKGANCSNARCWLSTKNHCIPGIYWNQRALQPADTEEVRETDSELLKRIDAAIERITSGHAPMRVPADPTDPDLVLADCKERLLATSHPVADGGSGRAGDRYEIAAGGAEEPGLILIFDNEKHIIIARSSEIALPLVEELVRRANSPTSSLGREWIPIETAPKDGTEFVTLNANQGNVKQLVHWNKLHGYWQSKGESIHMQATHYMLLPEPSSGK